MSFVCTVNENIRWEYHISLFARYRLFSIRSEFLKNCNGKKDNYNTEKVQALYYEIPANTADMTG